MLRDLCRGLLQRETEREHHREEVLWPRRVRALQGNESMSSQHRVDRNSKQM